MGRAAGTVGERGLGRHQRRDLQVHRRRHDLEAADEGPARRSSRRTSRSRRQTRSASTRSSPAYDEPGTSANRGASGIYRSDDAGENWAQITTDSRPASRIGGGDLPIPIPHPKDQDTVIVASTVSWKSTDGGKTWAPFKGAPGGEDYQNGWINPDNPDIIMLAADQGAVDLAQRRRDVEQLVQPADGALYHVTADNAFPYRVCSGQQESGSVCIAEPRQLRRDLDRDWLPVGVDEYGYVAPDPLDPDIVYGGER